MAVTLEQINAATDALAVQKLGVQIQFEQAEAYKAELAKVEAHRAAVIEHNKALEATFARQAAAAEAMLAAFKQQATGFDANERGEVMGKVFDQLVGKYMTPGTGTDPVTQDTDAKRDANYLKVAIQAAMGTYDALRTP